MYHHRRRDRHRHRGRPAVQAGGGFGVPGPSSAPNHTGKDGHVEREADARGLASSRQEGSGVYQVLPGCKGKMNQCVPCTWDLMARINQTLQPTGATRATILSRETVMAALVRC